MAFPFAADHEPWPALLHVVSSTGTLHYHPSYFLHKLEH